MVGTHSERSSADDDSSPGSPPEATGDRRPSPRPGARPGPSRSSRWHAALAVLGLSVLLPGTGHFYVGYVRRAIVWSLLFLLGVLPTAVFAFLVASSFTWKSVYWIAIVVVVFGLACSVRPLLAVLRPPRGGAEAPGPPPHKWVLGAYVGAGVVLAVLEAVVFLGPCLHSARVESSALAPLLSPGESVTLLVSRYVHPVHGDVVLFRVRLGGGDSVESAPRTSSAGFATKLGRVLAEGDDLVEAHDGQLFVNGVLLDLSRTDQAWQLAKAGRAERRRRALRSLLKPVAMFIPGLGEEVVQNVVRWDDLSLEASYVPEDTLLILPDWEQESVAPTEPPGPGNDPGRRPRWAILVPRTAIQGRMIF